MNIMSLLIVINHLTYKDPFKDISQLMISTLKKVDHCYLFIPRRRKNFKAK